MAPPYRLARSLGGMRGRSGESASSRCKVRSVTETRPGTDEGTAAWHRRLHHTGHHELSEDTAQTPGMRRYEAISGRRNGSRKIWMGESRIDPGMVSGDHHHGEAETGIYVVSGHPEFVFLEAGEERRVRTSPGDYVYVPPFVPTARRTPPNTRERSWSSPGARRRGSS
jgi:uncharacterized RmlC-like cupin family protein